jgi:hypothetical protein
MTLAMRFEISHDRDSGIGDAHTAIEEKSRQELLVHSILCMETL